MSRFSTTHFSYGCDKCNTILIDGDEIIVIQPSYIRDYNSGSSLDTEENSHRYYHKECFLKIKSSEIFQLNTELFFLGGFG